MSFLSAAFGLFVDPEVIDKVQLLIQHHGTDLASVATGPHAELIRHTFEALQKYHAAALAGGKVGTEQIEVAFLLGNRSFNRYILAISIGAVFFGANTYIGNGPNFMVKAIADHQKVHTPGFLRIGFPVHAALHGADAGSDLAALFPVSEPGDGEEFHCALRRHFPN